MAENQVAVSGVNVLTRVEYHSRRIGMYETIAELRLAMLRERLSVEDLEKLDKTLIQIQIRLEEQWEEMRI